jgi:hypothetical protein
MFYFLINFSVVKVQHYHMYGYCIVTVIFSVVKNNADPDQTCHFDADPAPGLDSGWHQNIAILPQVFHILKNWG